ncbi:hypothetical protein LTS18_000819 [Coniosporium uncinatum]|uniref:Uncharacterized protein n=1 Tax=Coniosporium uncinatum TaxID=93489 RepID=A0ACC3CU92_9PEZI|nr:hypothetical protein LTS18_000819 [Coniosporium uncinatum]
MLSSSDTSSGWASPPSNYVGTALFLSYIVAALILMGFIVFDLLAQSKRRSQNVVEATKHADGSGGALAAGWAAISFAVLSFHMLNVLIASYKSWAGTEKIDLSETSIQAAYKWMMESTLFQDFARDIIRDDVAWWWTQLALIWTMGVSVFMGVEGKLGRAASVTKHRK